MCRFVVCVTCLTHGLRGDGVCDGSSLLGGAETDNDGWRDTTNENEEMKDGKGGTREKEEKGDAEEDQRKQRQHFHCVCTISRSISTMEYL